MRWMAYFFVAVLADETTKSDQNSFLPIEVLLCSSNPYTPNKTYIPRYHRTAKLCSPLATTMFADSGRRDKQFRVEPSRRRF